MKLPDNTHCYYTPDPGEVPEGEEVFCGVCGDKMNEKRNCYGPRSSVEAMGGFKSHYDSFVCPNYKTDWHEQVVKLRDAADRTPSSKIAKIYLEEADEIAESRKSTK